MKKILLKLADSRLLFLLIMPMALYMAFSPLMPLIDPDESRYAEISDHMADSGDYVVPRLHHVIYLEKPPLSYWASAVIFKCFGKTDFTARLYVALCAWACILLTYAIGSFLRDRKTGLYAAGVLSTSLLFFLMFPWHFTYVWPLGRDIDIWSARARKNGGFICFICPLHWLF
jgi:4-amino-4-deoxy-L-arabinose transferase-like glycosyltransferase